MDSLGLIMVLLTICGLVSRGVGFGALTLGGWLMFLYFSEESGHGAKYGLSRGAPEVTVTSQEVADGTGFSSGKEMCTVKVTGPDGRLAFASLEARVDAKGRVVFVLTTKGPDRDTRTDLTARWLVPVVH